jgi:hypothetical protein
MKQKRFRAEQIVVLLRNAEKEGGPVVGYCPSLASKRNESTKMRWEAMPL